MPRLPCAALADPDVVTSDPVGIMIGIHEWSRPPMQELVRLLLANGAHPNDMVDDIDSGSRAGPDVPWGTTTALHAACTWAHNKGDYTMVQILMEAGGDPNLPNSWNGRTALQYARAKKDTRLLDLLHLRWREEYLAGHSPSAPKKKGVRRATPLAERAERAGVVKQLRPLPELPEFASAEQTEAHKKDVHKIQVANRQIVFAC